eukprot:scaffold4855_cov195-Amphora_coffeaeformis.AAC.4
MEEEKNYASVLMIDRVKAVPDASRQYHIFTPIGHEDNPCVLWYRITPIPVLLQEIAYDGHHRNVLLLLPGNILLTLFSTG